MDAHNAAMLIKIDQDVFSFVWTINNYSTQLELGAVESPVFRGGPKNNYGWQLKLKESERCEGKISLRLRLIDRGNEDFEDEDGEGVDVRAKFRFSIIDADGQPCFQIGGPGMKITRFSSPTQKWGYDDFADLLNPSNLSVDDKVKILCKIWIYGDSNQTVMNWRGAKFNPSHEDRFRMSKDGIVNDLGKLFKESIGTDVTISGSNTNFKAHKLILSARSTVFAAMFNSNMLENRSNFVEIADFEDDVVKGMLDHLYTGKTDCMDELAPNSSKSREVRFGGLKADCVYELGDKLNLENAGELLVLAQTHNAPDLKARAMDFINLNKDKLLKSKSFKNAVKLADAETLAELYFSQL
ncbi:Speckle-type POZ protein [Orchesella cincta]|uniref:Speckle-type POZ protein n=1 Tax=Orchesella cincta TaxID=48709 RepID=A0A1D2M6W3_ORCCI|nr:Speckle-type POZ protein [Orchesella cincta]